MNNGYRKYQGLKAFQKATNGLKAKTNLINLVATLHLPFIQGTTNNFAHILRKNNIFMTFKPLSIICSSLRSSQYKVDSSNTKGVYLIPCSYGKPFIREMGHSIKHRIREQCSTNIRHNFSRSSTLVEHFVNRKHHICIENSYILANISH